MVVKIKEDLANNIEESRKTQMLIYPMVKTFRVPMIMA